MCLCLIAHSKYAQYDIYIYTYIDLKLTHVLLIYTYIIIYLGKLQYFTNLKSSAILYRIVVPTNHHYSGVAVRLL